MALKQTFISAYGVEGNYINIVAFEDNKPLGKTRIKLAFWKDEQTAKSIDPKFQPLKFQDLVIDSFLDDEKNHKTRAYEELRKLSVFANAENV